MANGKATTTTTMAMAVAAGLLVLGAGGDALAQTAPAGNGAVAVGAVGGGATAATAPGVGTAQNPVVVQLHPEIGQMPTTVAMSGPRVIEDYDDGDPVPPGYHPDTRIRKGLVIGGVVPFGVFYLFSAMTAAIAHDAGEDDDALYIPAIGPFVQLAKSQSQTAKFFCGLDGVVQSLGLAMAIYGLAAPKTVLVRNDLAKEQPRRQKLDLHPMPFVARTGAGVGVIGSF